LQLQKRGSWAFA